MIRPAESYESDILTALSFTSKAFWGYPKEYFDIWCHELTISSAYIRKNDVFVYQLDDAILGYYSLVQLKEHLEIAGIILERGFWLEHMFIHPQHLCHGIGTRLFHHLRKRCSSRGIDELRILADPNSRGFYEKMGGIYQREYPSTIKGRSTPLLRLPIRNN